LAEPTRGVRGAPGYPTSSGSGARGTGRDVCRLALPTRTNPTRRVATVHQPRVFYHALRQTIRNLDGRQRGLGCSAPGVHQTHAARGPETPLLGTHAGRRCVHGTTPRNGLVDPCHTARSTGQRPVSTRSRKVASAQLPGPPRLVRRRPSASLPEEGLSPRGLQDGTMRKTRTSPTSVVEGRT